jgi:phosphoglycerate dehydrogenase-like enzyme
MKVLLHYNAGPDWRRDMEPLVQQGLEVVCCDEADDKTFYAVLPEIEVIWHSLRPIRAEDMAQASKLRLIQKIGVGVNTIDLEAAEENGVAVCNMPGSNAQAVAEMTLLLMLACLRRLPVVHEAARAGQGWALDPALQDTMGEVKGRTVGLVGMGSIPRALLPALKAMGARVVYTAKGAKTDVDAEYRDLDDLLAEADIVSLHVPLTAETEELLDRNRLMAMRRGAILINTARGGLVEQMALVDALTEGPLLGAGLDVFAAEPIPVDDPLLRLDNVVLAPHLAWLTKETLARSLAVAVENCLRLKDGRDLLNRVV